MFYMKTQHILKILQKKEFFNFDPQWGSRPLASGAQNHAAERYIPIFDPIWL